MTLIEVSGCAKFGDMTKGDGIHSVFDASTKTVAYAEKPTGYVGASFGSPRRIGKVEIFSADNGFDASGLNSQITLKLMAKSGAAPSGHSDGVTLAVLSFNDQNFVRSIALESLDKETIFDHAWVVVTTGVWSIVSEVKFYEAQQPVVIPDPDPIKDGAYMMKASCDYPVPLSHGGSELPQLRIRFLLDRPRQVLIDFHACATHTGVGSDALVAVGYSFRACYRSASKLSELSSKPFIERPNAANGGNIINRNPHHYGNASLTDGIDLPAGAHEISIIGSGHTDGSATAGLIKMLVEGGKGLNCLRVVVLP